MLHRSMFDLPHFRRALHCFSKRREIDTRIVFRKVVLRPETGFHWLRGETATADTLF
jgi:hypothetical protein